MKAIKVTLSEIKEIKKLMNAADRIKEDGAYIDGYVIKNRNKDLIDAKEAIITKNVKIVAKLLKVDYNTVIDMCYDFDFAEIILDKQYGN